jgi:hypothetical protein
MTAGEFLNVDLDIESKADLAPLAAELEPTTTVVHSRAESGRHVLKIESWKRAGSTEGPDQRIHGLCQSLERLSPAGRELWQSALARQFGIGYYATTKHVAAHFALRVDTLERIARLGATLAVTVYKGDAANRKIGDGPGISSE